MKGTFIFSILAVLLVAQNGAALTQDDMLQAVLEQKENSFATSLASIVGLERQHDKESSHGAYALIKYIVVPSKAKAFISVIEEAKKDAETFKGYKAYDLVKTLDDNISYIGWAAWESPEDLIHYIKSDEAKKVLEYTVKEDIVTLISAVKPIV